MSPEIQTALGLLGAYLLGSIPGSWMIAYHGWGVDIRKVGSGNPGATNVYRTLGKRAGIPALVVDAGKGAAAVWLAGQVERAGALDLPLYQLVCGMMAVVGHTFPIFLGFKGGKGVATGAGVMLTVAPVCVGLSMVVFAATVALTRTVALGSILAATALPVFVVMLHESSETALRFVAGVMAVFIVYRHRSNLRRMMEGTELKVGSGPATTAEERTRT